MIEIKGWTRTIILGLGGFAGVLITAGIIHYAKKKGWIATD